MFEPQVVEGLSISGAAAIDDWSPDNLLDLVIRNESKQIVSSDVLSKIESIIFAKNKFKSDVLPTKSEMHYKYFLKTCDIIAQRFFKQLSDVKSGKVSFKEEEREQLQSYSDYTHQRFGVCFDQIDEHVSCCREDIICHWNRAAALYKVASRDTNNPDMRMCIAAVSDITTVLDNLDSSSHDDFYKKIRKMQALEKRASYLCDLVFTLRSTDDFFTSEMFEKAAFDELDELEHVSHHKLHISGKIMFEMALKDIRECFSMYRDMILQVGGEERLCELTHTFQHVIDPSKQCSCENKLLLPSHLLIETTVALCGSIYWSYTSCSKNHSECNYYSQLAKKAITMGYSLFPNFKCTTLLSIYLRDNLKYESRVKHLNHSIRFHEKILESPVEPDHWLYERYHIETRHNPYAYMCGNDCHEDVNLPNIYNNKGLQLKLMGKHEESLQTYNTLMEKYIIPKYDKLKSELEFEYLHLQRDEAFVLNNRGFTYLSLEKYPEAIQDFSRANTLDPTDQSYPHNLAFAYSLAGDNLNAILWYTNCIERFGKFKNLESEISYSHTNRGMSLMEIKRFDLAILDFKYFVDTMFSLYPENVPDTIYEDLAKALTYMAKCKKERGDIVAALSDMLVARDIMSELGLFDFEEWITEYEAVCSKFYFTI